MRSSFAIFPINMSSGRATVEKKREVTTDNTQNVYLIKHEMIMFHVRFSDCERNFPHCDR